MAWKWLWGARGRERSHSAPAPLFTPDTKAVQGKMILALMEGAQTLGYTREQVLGDLPVSVEELASRGSRVSWNTTVAAMENLARAGATLADFERMGAALSTSPHFIVERFGGFFLRPEHLLYLSVKWLGPSQFPVFHHEVDYSGRRMTLRLRLPAEFPGSLAFFHITRGALASVPAILSQPKAIITGPITTHAADLHIEVSPYRTTAGRARRIVGALLSAPRVVRTLDEQERELQRSFEASVRFQHQFRQMIDALPDAVLLYHGGAIVYANPELPRLLGFDNASQLIGKRWAELLHPDDAARAPAEPDKMVELRFRRRDGSAAVLELSPGVSILYDGEPACIVVARDISDRQQIQQKMAIADRMTSLGTLAAGLTHEINNPLTLVMSNLELLRLKAEDMAPHDRADRLVAAMEGAERIRQIAQDLKIFSQPNEDRPTLIDLADVVRSTLVLAGAQAKHRATLTAEIEDNLPAVLANKGRVGQVLLNVVINALHALPERPVADNAIAVRLFADDGAVVMEVQDNGSGIPPEVRARIFEPFFSTKDIAHGTGLGLAVAKEIIDHYGGTITFTTDVGVGTTFRIALPVAEHRASTAMQVATATAEAQNSACGRVLVIDDEPALLDAITAILSNSGHHIVTVSSGDEAIALLERDGRFDAIICDLMMAPGSGADVYAYLTGANPALARRLIFMTGGTFRAETREFLARVNNECLQKPFAVDQLSRAVDRVLQDW